jgi:allantoin racemase
MQVGASEMKILILNPNATEAMTDSMLVAARAALPEAEITGWTNHDGPPAIQGPEDGEAAVAGVLALLPAARAEGFQAIVLACFDDTGLSQIRHAASCPVLGIGEAAFHLAALQGQRFAVVTTLPVSIPVIEENIAAYGFDGICAGVEASGLAVLEVEAATPATMARLSAALAAAAKPGVEALVLGCAGMALLRPALQGTSPLPLIDGVAAACWLATALIRAETAKAA